MKIWLQKSCFVSYSHVFLIIFEGGGEHEKIYIEKTPSPFNNTSFPKINDLDMCQTLI